MAKARGELARVNVNYEKNMTGTSNESNAVVIDKGQLQEDQYQFPYHYIPYFNAPNRFRFTRSLSWGHEYLCYIMYVPDLVRSFSPRDVLDIGCGDGRLLGLLSNSGAVLKGVDTSHRAIMFARAFNPSIDFEVRDASELDDEFDIVISTEVLEHIPDEGVPNFIRTVDARVRPGGHAILTVPSVVVPLNKKHYRHYNIEMIKAAFADAGSEMQICNVAYIYKNSKLIDFLLKIMSNKVWTVDIGPISRLLWRYTERNLKFASASDGRHVVAVLKKPLN